MLICLLKSTLYSAMTLKNMTLVMLLDSDTINSSQPSALKLSLKCFLSNIKDFTLGETWLDTNTKRAHQVVGKEKWVTLY